MLSSILWIKRRLTTICGFILVIVKICPLLLPAMAFLERRWMEHAKVLRWKSPGGSCGDCSRFDDPKWLTLDLWLNSTKIVIWSKIFYSYLWNACKTFTDSHSSIWSFRNPVYVLYKIYMLKWQESSKAKANKNFQQGPMWVGRKKCEYNSRFFVFGSRRTFTIFVWQSVFFSPLGYVCSSYVYALFDGVTVKQQQWISTCSP